MLNVTEVRPVGAVLIDADGQTEEEADGRTDMTR
jgi:hypothetical protein